MRFAVPPLPHVAVARGIPRGSFPYAHRTTTFRKDVLISHHAFPLQVQVQAYIRKQHLTKTELYATNVLPSGEASKHVDMLKL